MVTNFYINRHPHHRFIEFRRLPWAHNHIDLTTPDYRWSDQMILLSYSVLHDTHDTPRARRDGRPTCTIIKSIWEHWALIQHSKRRRDLLMPKRLETLSAGT